MVGDGQTRPLTPKEQEMHDIITYWRMRGFIIEWLAGSGFMTLAIIVWEVAA